MAKKGQTGPALPTIRPVISSRKHFPRVSRIETAVRLPEPRRRSLQSSQLLATTNLFPTAQRSCPAPGPHPKSVTRSASNLRDLPPPAPTSTARPPAWRPISSVTKVDRVRVREPDFAHGRAWEYDARLQEDSVRLSG